MKILIRIRGEICVNECGDKDITMNCISNVMKESKRHRDVVKMLPELQIAGSLLERSTQIYVATLLHKVTRFTRQVAAAIFWDLPTL